MQKLSAAVITFNEERNIERCLQSLLGVADEIVVVDSLSTDKTEEICARYGVKFVKNKFPGYIEQKNFAIDQCAHDLVLSLDADEALSPALRDSILTVKESGASDGYTFNRATHLGRKMIRYAGWYPDRSLRLWDRRKGRWGGNNPHDKFFMQEGATKSHLAGDLLHYSYRTIDDLVAQSNKFSAIAAQSKFDKGKRSSCFKIAVYPAWRFFVQYFIRLGFLDGFYGFVVCITSAYEVFIRYSKLKELQEKR